MESLVGVGPHVQGEGELEPLLQLRPDHGLRRTSIRHTVSLSLSFFSSSLTAQYTHSLSRRRYLEVELEALEVDGEDAGQGLYGAALSDLRRPAPVAVVSSPLRQHSARARLHSYIFFDGMAHPSMISPCT